MRRLARHAAGRVAILLSLVVGSGCTSNSIPAATTPTPTITASVEPSPLPSSSFTSAVYGYSVEVPAGWGTIKAKVAWDGTSKTSSDSPNVDRWVSRTGESAWGFAAPYAGDLSAYTKRAVADNAKYHGDTCPPTPEVEDPITIGGEPGVLLAYDCGILINIAVTVHDGVGYTFALRDPTIPAATDPADAAIFAALLDSVALPAP
jgi:hypothetical protein